MTSITDLPTPSVVVREDRLEHNLRAMQQACDAAGVELRPHIKTHKLVPVARRQLELGAAGLTCAKLGEAEAMLPSGVREIFIAHSLVDHRQAKRLDALAGAVDEVRLAVTSEAHAEALLSLVAQTGRSFRVMLAVDTGLGREGVRDIDSAPRIAARLARSLHVELAGLYTHEGYFYTADRSERDAGITAMLERLESVRDAIDSSLPLWPGCSVTARAIAETAGGRVQAVRPGAYVFGDLYLSTITGTMDFHEVALEVLVTVVDKPGEGFALIDAGTKTFSSDRTGNGIMALAADGRDLAVTRANEEHGYVHGTAVKDLRIGDRLRFVPAHVCTVVNLTNEVHVLDPTEAVRARWSVDARGRTQ